jgi:hypothetical protein
LQHIKLSILLPCWLLFVRPIAPSVSWSISAFAQCEEQQHTRSSNSLMPRDWAPIVQGCRGLNLWASFYAGDSWISSIRS